MKSLPVGLFTSSISATLFLSYFFYLICRSFYRLYLSPLARIHVPGPKLAAITRLYECYYDMVGNGTYVVKIEEMHKRYGETLLFIQCFPPH